MYVLLTPIWILPTACGVPCYFGGKCRPVQWMILFADRAPWETEHVFDIHPHPGEVDDQQPREGKAATGLKVLNRGEAGVTRNDVREAWQPHEERRGSRCPEQMVVIHVCHPRAAR